MKLDVDEEILQDFLLEVDDMLAKLTDLFLKIESEPSHVESISELYRSFHTIKGGAGFLELKPIVELCHKVESVFSAVKSGKKELGQNDVDVIVSAYDVVVKMIEEVKSGIYPEVEYASHVEKLQTILDGESDKKNEETKEKGRGDNVVASVNKEEKTVVKKEENEAIPEKESSKNEKNIENKEKIEAAEKVAGIEEDVTKELVDTQLDAPFSFNSYNYEKARDVFTGKNMDEEILDGEFLQMLDVVYGENKGPTAKYDREKISEIIKKKKEEEKAAKKTAADKIKKESEGEVKKEIVKDKIKAKSMSAPAAAAKENLKDEDKRKSAKQQSTKKIESPNNEDRSLEVVKPVSVENVVNADPISKTQSAVDNSIRIDANRLDEIMNMVGELVLVRNRLVNLKDDTSDKLMLEAITNLDVVTSSLQTSVMQTRMQTVKKLFSKFPRIIRDLAKNLSKDVSVEIEGENTELDKSLIDSLSEPMVHLVRNAVDHGLETKEERIKARKKERCLIKLKAQQEGDHAYISISDDGRGINKKKILEKARASGVISADEVITDENKIYMLIFSPGFSTAESVTDISGRGVGMDIVKNKIESLNGELQVISKEGEGTTFKLKLPLTLAILPTLMVSVRNNIYAIPLSSVAEIINKQDCDIEHMQGEEVLIYRGKTVPMCCLSDLFCRGPEKTHLTEGKHIVIVNDNSRQLAFIVDSLEGQEEVVIKPFNDLLKNIQGFSGVTITGTGKLAIIIDVQGLVKNFLSENIISA